MTSIFNKEFPTCMRLNIHLWTLPSNSSYNAISMSLKAIIIFHLKSGHFGSSSSLPSPGRYFRRRVLDAVKDPYSQVSGAFGRATTTKPRVWVGVDDRGRVQKKISRGSWKKAFRNISWVWFPLLRNIDPRRVCLSFYRSKRNWTRGPHDNCSSPPRA